MSQPQQQLNSSSQYIIQSEIDNCIFTVDRKVIDSSTLLKNICGIVFDITKIIEPIVIKCPSESLKIFIQLINNYPAIENEHDIKFEKFLYDSFTSGDKQKLIKLIQNLCILDSDFFLDSIADYICCIFENEENEMDWNEIQEFLGLENDFSQEERNLIQDKKKFEYFFSMNTKNLKFPFPNKNLYLLKTDFSTPMNALIARIIQRSNEKISYLLSLINKTIKNEVDKYPLKVKEFFYGKSWNLKILFNNLNKRDLIFTTLDNRDYEEEFFNILKIRKIAAENVLACFGGHHNVNLFNYQSVSLNFVISKFAKIKFNGSYKSMYHFDVTKCPISAISYNFGTMQEWGIKFEEVYNHLIAKTFSKRINIITYDFFKITSQKLLLFFKKNQNASKFHLLRIINHAILGQEFIEFVTKYMEDDGIIQCGNIIQGIPKNEAKINNGYLNYSVLIVKEYLNFIVIKKKF